jgi:hypothetical protein
MQICQFYTGGTLEMLLTAEPCGLQSVEVENVTRGCAKSVGQPDSRTVGQSVRQTFWNTDFLA